MRRVLAISVSLLFLGLAGCTGDSVQEEILPEPPRHEAVIGEDQIDVRVTIPVALIGFSDARIQEVTSELDDWAVEHESLSFPRGFVTDEPHSFGTYPIGIVPTAAYEIHAFDDEFASRYWQHLKTNLVDGQYSSNVAQDWLMNELTLAGFPMDANVPGIVVIQGSESGHSYRLDMHNGWTDGHRVMGELYPFVAIDLSAASETFWRGDASYDAATTDADDDTVIEAIEDITRFRILQGPIYPVLSEPCHAITLVVGVRGTSVTELHPDFDNAQDVLDVEQLTRAFENATGDDVYVDPVFLLLPVDDPGLDVTSRLAARGTPYGMASARWWIDENWDEYWVPHEGCAAYVSFLLYGDFADGGLFGIAMYQVEQGHRVSFSLVGENVRFVDEYEGPGSGSVVGQRSTSRENPDWVDFLFAHETGHLLGQRHPHDITESGGGDYTWSFSSVWSSMSYQHQDRVIDFGKIDAANHARNEVGHAFYEHKDELTESQKEAVVEALEKAHWNHATAILLGGAPMGEGDENVGNGNTTVPRN